MATIDAQTTPTGNTSGGTHAIVIGASMAGLLAARVLSDHFDRVTIIERDKFPDGVEARKGVPQSYHAHILLSKGQQILRQLFPGLDQEMEASGAWLAHWGRDTVSLSAAGWSSRNDSGVATYIMSRPALETNVRRRVLALPKVSVLEAAEVTELLTNADKTAITGVQIRRRRGAEAGTGTDTLTAQLVVDASGRESHTPDWLKEMGYPAPEETVIDSFLGYASQWFKRPADFKADWKMLIIFAQPPKLPRGGVLMEVEGGQWILTLAGAGRDYPPTDQEGYMAFARSLPSPALYDVIKNAEPLTPIYGYQRTQNRWHLYHKLERWPENFVVVGDAVCGFNPIYGQGMTTAAQGAMVLDRFLRDYPAANRQGMGLKFQAALAKSNGDAWVLATGEDFKYPTTVGGKPAPYSRFMHYYVNRIFELGVDHPDILRTIFEVINLLKPPTAFFAPSIAVRVVKQIIAPSRRSGMENDKAIPKLQERALDGTS